MSHPFHKPFFYTFSDVRVGWGGGLGGGGQGDASGAAHAELRGASRTVSLEFSQVKFDK